MTVQTLRPDGTVVVGAFSAVPSGTLDEVTSDDNDSTYALGSGALNSPMILDLTSYTLTATQRAKLYRVRTRMASNTGGVDVTGNVQVNSGGLSAALNLPAYSSATPTDVSTGWRTPVVEVTNAAIIAASLQTAQTINGAAGLRIVELYLDLDVRERPVIDSVTIDATLGVPTYTVQFDYGTSGVSESVTVNVVVTDSDDNVVVSLSETVVGTDFSDYTVELQDDGPLEAGDYTATATVIAGGFVAPDTTFISEPNEQLFSVTPAGVNGPEITCETDQDAQVVTLTICQPDPGEPPESDCLVLYTSEIEIAAGAFFEVVGTPDIMSMRHITTWWQADGSATAVVATFDIHLDEENIEISGTVPSDGTLTVTRACVNPLATPNTRLTLSQIAAPGAIPLTPGAINPIVQARDSSTGLMVELGYERAGDVINVTGPFTAPVGVLVLDVAPTESCVPSIDAAITAPGDDVPIQFAAAFTLATFIDSGNLVSWPSVLVGPSLVTVESTANGTIYLSGILATFSDPDEVRVQVQRDGVDIPLDGENGALVPPFGDGCLIVTDRFPRRYRINTCSPTDVLLDGQNAILFDDEGLILTDGSEPVGLGPVYRARLYGYIEGVPSYSPWTTCQPDPVLHNGLALLRSPNDPDLDVMACVSSENFARMRPHRVVQPIDGGLPYGRIGVVSGRNYTVVFETPDTASMEAIETALSQLYVWYSPLNPALEPVWLLPDDDIAPVGHKVPERPYTLSQSMTNIEPDPVLLHDFGA